MAVVPSIGVLTVDDQPLFRTAAAAVVDATPGFETVGEAASGEEALRLSSELHPDLVLLDVRMPGMDGLETAQRLAATEPGAVIVLISIDDIGDIVPRARHAGAAASVRKQALCPQMLEELWAAHGRG
ncbi:MAG: response regulator transcription factor [Solirubrobacteraceae bacterium]